MVEMCAVVDFYELRMSLVTCLQRLRVNMVKTKILISAHHEHTFNNGAEFFFFFNCLALASSSTTPLQAEQLPVLF